MFPRARADRSSLRSFFAWLGLLLIILSVFWMEMLPPFEPRPAAPAPAPAANGFGAVIIDAGHGGQDSGAMQSGVVEKELSLDLAKRLQVVLASHGLVTHMTRSDDTYISLAERAAAANRQRDAVFVSIHFDDAARAKATGVETYYALSQTSAPSLVSWLPFLPHPPAENWSDRSQSLASFVQEALVRRTQAVNRGTRAEQFFVIANVRHPAVLVEGGFLTNKDDVGKLTNPQYREEMAAAICDGILKYREVAKEQTLATAAIPGA